MKKMQAAETRSLDQARSMSEASNLSVKTILKRLKPYLPEGRLKILEVGSAQGTVLMALAGEGHEAYGIEPYTPAIETAKKMAEEKKINIDVRTGYAEAIPFDSDQFDLVLAFSVMEHVEDLDGSLMEIARVLKPGGMFWFHSASSMCPIQNEIKGFPLFGWYPDITKKKIMLWAMSKKPELVGFTDHPALHWWTPANAKKRLNIAGFGRIWDRWDLSQPSEYGGYKATFTMYARRFRFIKLLGDLVVPSCSYAAKKSETNLK